SRHGLQRHSGANRRFLLDFAVARRVDENREYHRSGERSGDQIKPLIVPPRGLSQVCEKEGTEGSRKCPREQHQSKNRPNMARAKIIRSEGRRYPVSASVADEDYETDDE